MQIAVGLVLLLLAIAGLMFRIDPVPTWFYVLAWYPILATVDGIAARRDGRGSWLFSRSAFSWFAWSVPIWLVYEAANLRLQNWYYVMLPTRDWERWSGILLSFATVVPALVLAERVLDGFEVFRVRRLRPLTVRPGQLRAATLMGLVMGALALVFPRTFFPLIWGGVFLVADPIVYRRLPHLSLIGDLERGDWGRIGRLLVGGLGVGLIWESYNYWADGGWIYTVPWLEQLKLSDRSAAGGL